MTPLPQPSLRIGTQSESFRPRKHRSLGLSTKKAFTSFWLPSVCLAASLSFASAADPVLFFDFNAGTGTSSCSTGSNTAELLMISTNKEPLSLYSTNGSGLSGKSGDFALDIGHTTTAMGTKGGIGGTAKISTGADKLSPIISFTVTGWFKAASELGGGARLVEYTDPLAKGFVIFAGDGGVVAVGVNGKNVNSHAAGENCFGKGTVNQWVFFAFTYDGSKTNDNVVFYGGTTTNQPQVISTQSLDAGKIEQLNQYASFAIGNNPSGIRPFHGLLDNISFYSSASDATGALSLAQITTVYQDNLKTPLKGKEGAATAKESPTTGKPIKIGLIGDSTVCDYPTGSLRRGWGEMIGEFTTPSVIILNEAQGGRSSKSFPPDRWQKILTAKPDFVFIQFGHNDSHAPGQPESTDAATDFKVNLRRYITEARGASIVPVLVTPPHRRTFYSGHLSNDLAPYADAMKAVAAEMKVPLVDLYAQSGKWIEGLGEEGSSQITVNHGPDPAQDDRTHFTKEGATSLAKFVTASFPEIDPRLGKVLKTQ